MSMSPEPMSLGSPTQSPGGGGGGQQTPQPYLPQFLLGDMMNNSGVSATGLNSPLMMHHPLSRQQPTPQQPPNFFLSHHQQQYGGGPAVGGSGGSGGGGGMQCGQKFWHNQAVGGSGGGGGALSNSPPRSGSNFLLPHHHHHHPSLLQAPGGGVGRTYSMNAYDYGHMRTGSIGGGADKSSDPNVSGYGVPGGTGGYSPSPLQATPSNQQQSAPGAPPLNRLVDMMNAKPNVASPASISMTSMGGALESAMLSPYMPSSSSTSTAATHPVRLNSPPSPTQIDPFYTQANDSMQPLDDTWVTIFGHPPSATSYVLQEFATYGQIVRYVPPSQTEQGNWLHVKYQTRLQAQKALSKNGKVLGGQFMVGVMPCIDRKIMFGTSPSGSSGSSSASLLTTTSVVAANGEENTEPSSAATIGLGNKLGGGGGPRAGFAGAKLDRTQSLRTNARPLAMLNRAAAHDDSSIDGTAKLPKKNTNVISKAMEFMFGW